MDAKPILITDPVKPRQVVPDFALGWNLLWLTGWLFVIVGLLNIALIWIPLQLGNPEYEFASVAASLDSLPLPTMGLVFALAGSRATGRLGSAKVAMVTAFLVTGFIVAAALLYWLAVPLALKAVKEPVIRLGIMKSVVKVSAQALLYPIALVVLVRMANRSSSLEKPQRSSVP